MRWLRLYLRSRRVPVALAVAGAAVASVWALWLAFGETPAINDRAVVLTVTVAVAAVGVTLGGPDDALEHTGSVNWPVRRAGHLVLAAAAISAPMLLSAVTGARFAPFALVLRDTAGLLGLTALGAALIGTARAWIAPVTWALVTMLPLFEPDAQVVTWLVQPPGTTAAAACAGVLTVTGLVAYAARGCPRYPAPDN